MKPNSFTLPSVLLGLLCASVCAQRPGRSIATQVDRAHLGHVGNTDWAIGYSGDLFYFCHVTMDSERISSGISVPGCLQVISSQEALVGGRESSGAGIVEHWRYSGTDLVLVSSCLLPGVDIAGIVYAADHGVLYLLDSVGQKILKGPWGPSVSLSTLSTSQLVGQSGLADLANADERTIRRDGTTLPPTLQLVHWPFLDGQIGASVTDNAAGFSIGSFRRSLRNPRRNVFADQTTASEGGIALRVWAPSGIAFQVVRLDTGAVIGSGVGGTGGFATVTLSESLQLGTHYTAHPTDQPVPGDEGFSCVRRYGYPEGFSDGTAIDPMYFQRGAQVGKEFWIEVGLQRPSAPLATNIAINGIMLVGFRIAGIDPVVPYGNNWLLASGIYLPATCVVQANTGWGLAFTALTIPNDPGLVGLTYLTQFVMEDGPEYRLSEIYGANIEGSTQSLAGGAGQALFGPGSPSAEELAEQHFHSAFIQGQVFDSTPVLFDILSRR